VGQSDAVSAGQGKSLDDVAGLSVLDCEPHNYAVTEPGEQVVDEEPGGECIPHGY